MLRPELTADVSYGLVSRPRFVDSGADARSDIARTLTSFQPLGELLNLLDRVAVFLFESFESIFKPRQCFNKSRFCRRFSSGVLGTLHALDGLHQPPPVASRRGYLPLFPL